MLPSTIDAVRAVLRTDETLSARDRDRLLRLFRQPLEAQVTPSTAAGRPCLIRRGEAARRLSVSLRTLDKFCATGFLTKRVLPGRKRASGIPADQIDALILGKEVVL